MSIARTFLPAILALGLLLPGAAAAQNVQNSSDEKGTIHIGNKGPVSDVKSAGEGKAGDVKAQSEAVASKEEPAAPKRLSTRPSGREIEKRRKAFREVFPPRQTSD